MKIKYRVYSSITRIPIRVRRIIRDKLNCGHDGTMLEMLRTYMNDRTNIENDARHWDRIVVAFEGQRPIGWSYRHELPHSTHIALFVLSAYRRKGIGTKMAGMHLTHANLKKTYVSIGIEGAKSDRDTGMHCLERARAAFKSSLDTTAATN